MSPTAPLIMVPSKNITWAGHVRTPAAFIELAPRHGKHRISFRALCGLAQLQENVMHAELKRLYLDGVRTAVLQRAELAQEREARFA